MHAREADPRKIRESLRCRRCPVKRELIRLKRLLKLIDSRLV